MLARRFLGFGILAALLWALSSTPGVSQEPAPAPAPEPPSTPPPPATPEVKAPRAWSRLTIDHGDFSADKLGLLDTELAPLAAYLAIYAYREFAEGVWKGDLASHVMARRYLALALHLSPQNREATAINDWLDTKVRQAQPPELPMSPVLFSGTIARLVERLLAAPDTTDTIRRAVGYLSLVGAEIEPENETLVYQAEVFLRKFDHEGQAWKELHQGKAKR